MSVHRKLRKYLPAQAPAPSQYHSQPGTAKYLSKTPKCRAEGARSHGIPVTPLRLQRLPRRLRRSLRLTKAPGPDWPGVSATIEARLAGSGGMSETKGSTWAAPRYSHVPELPTVP
ncbi:hypothetical protein CDD80_4797 [Ophiocordyceps camponoti-rufipedis]|uniref:Uncharacterized protein n=1 Tax=Ophiocordyceps camponoti-rufipedis TaxID=2004952 RepID=A0A2C5YYS7_9HYPO|nr:hypothetical protein CDD80_4797 [Ophiocordyceps camponoti-rufipedis]